MECASVSLIPKFLRVTLDTFWRARIDLCLHGLVQPRVFRHVSFLPKQLVGLFVKTMLEARIPLCAREIRKRLTHLQGEEVACPAEDDEPVAEPVYELVDEPADELGDEHVKEPVELQE